MTIAYTVGDGLYLNITNRCSNSCDFCIRNNGDGAYGSDSLWLPYEPSVVEILAAIEEKDLSQYRELVFCGYGEPTYRLDEMLEVCRSLKKKYPQIPIRLNTNGHADLIHGKDVSHLFEGLIDVVSISLNQASAEKYQALCHSVFGEAAYEGLLQFAGNVKKYVPTVLLSVVKETMTEEELLACHRICDAYGLQIKVRNYISA